MSRDTTHDPVTAPSRSARLWPPAAAGIGAALLLMLASLSSIASIRAAAHEAIDQEVRQNLSRMAAMAASTIDGDAHRRLVAAPQEGGALYASLNAALRKAIDRTEGIRFVYTLRPAGDRLLFVLDGTEPGDADHDGVEDHSALMEVYENPDPAAWEAIRTRGITVTTEPYADAWGSYLSGFAPVFTGEGDLECVVGVDVSARAYHARLATVDRATALALLPAGLMSLGAGLGAWWASRRLVRYAREIVDHREEAERANNAKSALLANISHELRTPLNAIMGFVGIAADERCGAMERAEAAGTIRHNAEHLLTLINDLLDISKAEAGALTIDPTEIDLPQLIERAAAPLRLRAMEKRIGFTIEGLATLPPRAVLDRTRVRQVLLNLLGNAVKFTDEGGVGLRVSAGGGVLRLRVEDTGPGMSRDEIARLFRPFTQLGPQNKRQQGTGLGLAISRNLTELMGGRIGVESTPGRGSVFTAEIPFAPAGPAQERPGAERAPAPTWERLEGTRIAVAEDGHDNRRLLRLILRRAGAEVIEFGEGESARAALLRDPGCCQLLVTDWDMPVLSGEGLVRTLRESGWTRPIVSLTAHAQPEQEQACLRVGCDAHLTKPLNAEALVETCAALIAQHGGGARAA